MFSTISDALKGVIAAAFLFTFVASQALAGAGGPEHSHGPGEVSGSVQPHPRFVAESEANQVVGVFRNGSLTLYLDRQSDNAPITDVPITLEVAGQLVPVEAQPDGTFRATPEAMPQAGEIEILVTIGGAEPDLLIGTLDLGHEEAGAGQGVLSGIKAFLHRPVEMQANLKGVEKGFLVLSIPSCQHRDQMGRHRSAPR